MSTLARITKSFERTVKQLDDLVKSNNVKVGDNQRDINALRNTNIALEKETVTALTIRDNIKTLIGQSK